ncbi:phospholipase A and acyltransferase 3-like [Ahaetulla prasina]|uniref:phospholipase A and acyltransferase 3-like n=1 Tax=Ahaetulla prasina TaxID=499056 RepID=UPI002649C4A3|nr:phospholipase A and acyltransferase 3-like [Ahaetulla prasina]
MEIHYNVEEGRMEKAAFKPQFAWVVGQPLHWTGIKKDVEHVFQNGDLPKPGDMIQFQMLGFQHWGIYIGEEQVVHFAWPPLKFKVRKEKIKDVPGVLKTAVWNKFDEKYTPLDPACVVKRARSMENKVLRYNPTNANCEHFATLMRYDKALSDQAERFYFTVDRGFEQEIRRYLAEVDCGWKR